MSPSCQRSIFRLCQPWQKIWWEHSNAILSSLAENNIDVAFVVGQGYARFITAMLSEACSVQGRKNRIAPALRTYCNSHVLNLSIAVAHRLTPVTETWLEPYMRLFPSFIFRLKDSDFSESGCQDLHSCICTMTLKYWRYLYSICSQAPGKDVPEVYPLRVKSMSTVREAKKTGVQ